MPLVYACIRPSSTPDAPPAIAKAAAQTNDELASYQPATVVLIVPSGATGRDSMHLATQAEGVDVDRDLAERIMAGAQQVELPVATGMRWPGDAMVGAAIPEGAALLPVVCSWLDARFHFEFGRAISRALDGYEPAVAAICLVDVSRPLGADGRFDPAARAFDQQYRRAIERWDVKWLLHLDPEFRRSANEAAVAPTAVLMGALSGSRIQPRVLAESQGQLVAAIDVLGPRRKRSEESYG
jgi:hypothetical protein